MTMKIVKWTVDRQEGIGGTSGHLTTFSAGFCCWIQREQSSIDWVLICSSVLETFISEIHTCVLRCTRWSTSLLTKCRCSLMSLKCWMVSYVPKPPPCPWCWTEPICLSDSWKEFLHGQRENGQRHGLQENLHHRVWYHLFTIIQIVQH